LYAPLSKIGSPRRVIDGKTPQICQGKCNRGASIISPKTHTIINFDGYRGSRIPGVPESLPRLITHPLWAVFEILPDSLPRPIQ